MSGTEESNGFFKNHVHDLFIHNSFKPKLVEDLIKRQKRKKREINKEGGNPKDPGMGVGLVLDDLMYDKKMIKEKSMRQIFMNGRHYNILPMVTAQYCMDIPPDIRTNIDYVIVLRDNNRANQKRLFDYFFGVFPKFADFQKVFNTITNNYGALVLDNASKSNRIEDCVYWYKARFPVRKFKIGTRNMWSEWDRIYKPDYDDNDDNDDDDKRKPASNITVVQKGYRK